MTSEGARTHPGQSRASATESATPLLDVRQLRLSFGNTEILKGLDLHIERGECLGLIGSSGSGKSLTARSLIGLAGPGARVGAERMRLGETDLLGLPERRLQQVRGGRIGLVLQDALVSLDPARTIGAELEATLRRHTHLRREARTRRAVELLELVGLPDPEMRVRQRPDQLSGGQRQRALIAIALAGDPELIVADEPTTALDAIARRELLALLRSLADTGISVLFVSHDLASVRVLCDRVAVIDDGRIVETAQTSALLDAPASAAGRALVGALPRRPRKHDAVEGPAVLQAQGLEQRYHLPAGGEFVALRGASLGVRRGETLGIVGASGSGKSTLARILLALDPPAAGYVEFEGSPWAPLAERRRRSRRGRIGMVAQDPLSTFDPRLRVGHILADAISGGRTRRPQRLRAPIRAALAEVGLPPEHINALPLRLSGGERQRVAIARALAGAPHVLVCDEAVSALDSTVRRQILDLIAQVRSERGLACVFISHDLDVVGEISDRVAVLDHGEIVETAQTHTLFTDPQHGASQALLEGHSQ